MKKHRGWCICRILLSQCSSPEAGFVSVLHARSRIGRIGHFDLVFILRRVGLVAKAVYRLVVDKATENMSVP